MVLQVCNLIIQYATYRIPKVRLMMILGKVFHHKCELSRRKLKLWHHTQKNQQINDRGTFDLFYAHSLRSCCHIDYIYRFLLSGVKAGCQMKTGASTPNVQKLFWSLTRRRTMTTLTRWMSLSLCLHSIAEVIPMCPYQVIQTDLILCHRE